METEEERVDGRELRPPREPGSDERLSDRVLARIGRPNDDDDDEEEDD
jgi:hypothetical protein